MKNVKYCLDQTEFVKLQIQYRPQHNQPDRFTGRDLFFIQLRMLPDTQVNCHL